MSMLKEILSFITGEGVSNARKAVKEGIAETKTQIEEAARQSVKRAILGVMFLIGIIFILVGLAQYLQASVRGLDFGLGYIIVGGAMVLLGLLVKALR